MMSLPSASGELFSSFIVLLHTTHPMRSISGLLSSLRAVLTSPSPSADQREPHEILRAPSVSGASGWPFHHPVRRPSGYRSPLLQDPRGRRAVAPKAPISSSR